jgi:Ca2+-binding EF-hand superfamily protein
MRKTEWGLECVIEVPTNKLNLPKEVKHELHSPKWNLVIICRDGSRAGYPQVGQAVTPIAWSLMARSREVDQWIPLFINLPQQQIQHLYPLQDDEEEEYEEIQPELCGRIRVKLNIIDGYDSINNTINNKNQSLLSINSEQNKNIQGIGEVVVWLNNLTQSTIGQDDELLPVSLVTASVYMKVPTIGNVQFAESNISSVSTLKKEQNFCGIIPISGGDMRIKLNVVTPLERIPYVTFFPVLATKSIYDPDSKLMPELPSLTLNMSTSSDLSEAGDEIVQQPGKNRRNNKKGPKLNVNTVFVPYVHGKLVINYGEVKFNNSVSNINRFNSGSSRRGVFRAVLNTSSYTFSSPIDMNFDTNNQNNNQSNYQNNIKFSNIKGKSLIKSPSGTHSSRPRSPTRTNIKSNTRPKSASLPTKPIPSKNKNSRPNNKKLKKSVSQSENINQTNIIVNPALPDNIVYLSVDTVKAKENKEFDHGITNPYDVKIYLLDEDSGSKESDCLNSNSDYCVGISVLPTAILYYQALRAAASSSNLSIQGENFVASSPWSTSELIIVDPLSDIEIGTVTISVRFILDNVSSNVMKFVNQAKAKIPTTTVDGEEDAGVIEAMSRMEMGLKQAFLAADEDKSGSVSASELFKIIKSAGGAKKSKKSQTVPVGLEDSIGLLLSLAKGIVDKDDADSDQTYSEDNLRELANDDDGESGLEVLVHDIFNRLDVDGDGNISWWEWKAVLSSSLRGRNPNSKYINPMDPFVLGLEAAYEAMLIHGMFLFKFFFNICFCFILLII